MKTEKRKNKTDKQFIAIYLFFFDMCNAGCSFDEGDLIIKWLQSFQ